MARITYNLTTEQNNVWI